MNAIIQSMQGMNSVRVIILSVVGIILLLAFAFLSMRLTSPVLSPIYNNLSSEDNSAIATELSAMGVTFEVNDTSGKIMVPSSEILKIRMALASKGLPNKGSIVGYEVFDKDEGIGTSNFVLNINLLRALEGELGRTISSLKSIRNARVHLVLPKKEIFRKGKVMPSASVILTLNNQNKLPKSEISSIQHMVSSAVPNLSISRVTIVDNNGRLLARGSRDNEDSPDGGTNSFSTAREYVENYEKRTKNNLESIIEEIVGIDKVRAQVSVKMNFDRTSTVSETFNPDGQVARSVQTTENSSSSSTGSSSAGVSVANNLPDASVSSAGGGGAGEKSNQLNEVTNFEISKKQTNFVAETGKIERLSIAILVDGKYKTTIDEDEVETQEYIPRSDEELDQIKTLVKSSVGFDEKRGDTIEVINLEFTKNAENFLVDDDPLSWLKKDLDSILKTVVVGIVAILTILLVIKPLVNKAFEISPSDLAEEQMNSMAQFEMENDDFSENLDIDLIQNKVDSSPVKKINDIIDNNPEETIQVIRNWMNEEN